MKRLIDNLIETRRASFSIIPSSSNISIKLIFSFSTAIIRPDLQNKIDHNLSTDLGGVRETIMGSGQYGHTRSNSLSSTYILSLTEYRHDK